MTTSLTLHIIGTIAVPTPFAIQFIKSYENGNQWTLAQAVGVEPTMGATQAFITLRQGELGFLHFRANSLAYSYTIVVANGFSIFTSPSSVEGSSILRELELAQLLNSLS